MKISDLPVGSAPAPVKFMHFPTRWQAFLWRNWEFFPAGKLAEVLGCSETDVRRAAAELGLPDQKINPKWLIFGYLTILRSNWHLLNYRQLLQLLDWTPEQLAYTLKEEDFFWAKLGRLKPACDELRYAPLTAAEKSATDTLRKNLASHLSPSCMAYQEEPFAFAEQYKAQKSSAGTEKFELNFIHSYAASCGDIFIDIEKRDPVPENLLEQYASMGIKGVWMHAILYLLHPVGGSEEFSEGYQTRLRNLATLVKRCKKYGIGIYLYLNEPRGMPYAFYQKNPDWAGIDVSASNMRTNCISRTRKPLEWLEEACRAVFRAVPDLAGAFMISMSENPTHCNYGHKKGECQYCRDRDGADLIADVAKAMEKGIHAGSPDAKLIVEDWAWRGAVAEENPTEFKKRVIDRLPQDVWFMSISEWGKETNAGGVKFSVVDYSISQVGPSSEAVDAWKHAQKRGLKTVAKIQMNNSWELSAVPYIPVPYLLQEHLDNLSSLGVNGLMLSWTLGGYPGGNLELLYKNVEELAADKFRKEAAGKVCSIWKKFSDAFREYPFSCATIYVGPMNYGPMAPFFLEPTGYRATMIGYPYDDLEGWRSVYPEAVFEDQFRKVTEGWKQGLDKLAALKQELSNAELPAWEELWNMAAASYCHLRSTYLQIRFVRQRNAGDPAAMRGTVQEELELTHMLYEIARRDSRIGFEASNHYYYCLNDLAEKMINCEYILGKIS